MFSLNIWLEYLFNNISAQLTTEIFLWITLLSLIWAIIQSLRGKVNNFVSYTPTLLTSLGILGTFIGVIIGLLDFDSHNIDASVPKLLEGLKTAFITSIWGTGLSIFFKIIAPLITPQPAPKQPTTKINSTGQEAIIEGLQAIINNTNKHNELTIQNNELLVKIQKNLAGTEESSLAGQLKLTRADAIDHHKEMMRSIIQQTELLTKMQINLTGNEESSLIGQLRLLRLDINEFKNKSLEIIEQDRKTYNEFANKLWQQLETFAQMLSKSATEQVINALKAVISDFNSKLTEQFGQNFKELNTAVGHLVTWQDNYRIQLEQMSDQYAQSITAINKTSDAITNIANTTQQIPITMQQLQVIIEVNQHQLAELARHLDTFRDMRDKAVEAVPIMQQQIDSMMTDIKHSVDHANEHYTVLLNKANKYIQDHDQQTRQLLDMINTHAQGLATTMTGETKAIAQTLQTAGQQTQRDIQNTQQQVAISITEMQKQVETAIKNSASIQINTMNSIAEGFRTKMSEAITTIRENTVSTLNESVNNQFKAMDEVMRKEIIQVIQTMGNYLAKITIKFNEDFKQSLETTKNLHEQHNRTKN